MFAQESVMDFQKEKEAFESVFTEAKGWDLTFIMGCYQNIETLRAFAGWLAAKAQAVPDGYCVVPKEPTPKMSIAYQKNAIAPVSSLSISGYKAMIEAQEPTND